MVATASRMPANVEPQKSHTAATAMIRRTSRFERTRRSASTETTGSVSGGILRCEHEPGCAGCIASARPCRARDARDEEHA